MGSLNWILPCILIVASQTITSTAPTKASPSTNSATLYPTVQSSTFPSDADRTSTPKSPSTTAALIRRAIQLTYSYAANTPSTANPTECVQPPGLNNGIFTPNITSYIFNDKVTYICNPSYELDRETATSKCTDTDTWTPQEAPVCLRKKCAAPSIPQHGKIEPDGMVDYWVNTTVAYICNSWYQLNGSETATCMESKQWSSEAPTCTLIKISYNGSCNETWPVDQCKTDNAQCLKLEDRNSSRCLCNQTFFFNSVSCVKKILYNHSCNEAWPDNQCLTDNAQCLKLEDRSTCTCRYNHTLFYRDIVCVKKIAYNTSCEESGPAAQCQTENALCLNLNDQNIWTCRCNQTFFHYNDTFCAKRNDYNVADLNFKVQPSQTKETTATLAWLNDPNTPQFYYFVAVVQNQDGDEVTRLKNYFNMAPPADKSTVLKGFEPGHRYTVVIHIFDADEIPSLKNVTLNFCTRPLGVARHNLKNFTESSFGITWDYDTLNVFSTLVVILSSSQQIPNEPFVNCPGQQHDVCTLPRNDSVKYLHVHNLTPGTQYNVSIYTSACDSGLHSIESQTSSYTVPSLPKFTVEDSGAGITDRSVKVKLTYKDDAHAGQFQEWHAVVTNMYSSIIKDDAFKNDVFEGTIQGLSSATEYTVEFYTSVPGQHSNTSPPVLFYTRPRDVTAAYMEHFNETYLTVSIPGQVDNSDVFYRVNVSSTNGHHDVRNVTGDKRSVIVTGLSPATNYTITVYAVLKKNDGSLFQSVNAFVTWSISGNIYDIADLNFKIQTDQTTETTVRLAWSIDQHTPPFWYFVAVVQNQYGDEVTNFKEYYSTMPPVDKSTLLQGLEPGHRYSAIIHVYDDGRKRSLRNVTLNFCTRPLGVASINLENLTESSFYITWEYNTMNVFSNLVITLTSTQQIPDESFVNCPGQRHGVCILARNDSVKYLHILNLTPGTLYNVFVYTCACDSGLRSVENQTNKYTVPCLPEFTVEDSGPGITASSVKVKCADNNGTKSGQFQNWHVVVRNMSATIIKDETFKNDVCEGVIQGLSSASKYTMAIYTTVPGQQSRTSEPVQFCTRPRDVTAANVEAVHETNLTVSIPGQADNGDVFFLVGVTSTNDRHDIRNVSDGRRYVTVTGLTPATNYTITVYAVLKKNDGTLLQSSNAFETWSFSGPPPPAGVTIDAIEGDTITFTPSVNITQKVTFDVSYESISGASSSGHKDNFSGQIKLVNLTMGTGYRILIYTKLIQTAIPNIIRSDRFYELITYTKHGYNVADLHFQMQSERTTETSATLIWHINETNDIFRYFLVVIRNQAGDEVTRFKEYYDLDPTSQSKVIHGLEPDHRYLATINVYQTGIPSLDNVTVNFYTHTERSINDSPIHQPLSAGMVAGVTSAVVVLVVAVGAVVLMRKMQMVCFGRSNAKENTQWSEPPVSTSEMKDISVTCNNDMFKPGPVRLTDFPAYVERLHRDNNRLFAEAFRMLKTDSPLHSTTVAEEQRNKQKNRYINILAYDHSRVKLPPGNDEEQSDYINANHISGYCSSRGYIAAQGPQTATINDFWRMVLEQNVGTIVMLTKLEDKGRNKCIRYWPERNETSHYGDVTVCVQSESNISTYTIRDIEVKMVSSRRLVHHFAYLGWPETGCPDNPTQMLEFVKTVQEHSNVNNKKAPILVHCGTGVGRTGVFIAVDYIMQYIQDHDDIDIYKLVLEMRNYRCHMVQTEEQFAFIHDCFKEVTTGDGVENEAHYQSLDSYDRTPEHVYDSHDLHSDM